MQRYMVDIYHLKQKHIKLVFHNLSNMIGSAIPLLLLLSVLLQVGQCHNYDWRSGRNVNLLDSTWPSDHGDVSRSKYSIGAGLPKHFNASDLKSMTTKDLPNAQWLYTGGEDSKYTYVMGGSLPKLYVAKVDGETMELLGKYYMQNSLYLGGMLMHKNGHVYAVHGNILYVFWEGNFDNVTVKRIPSGLNGNLVQTNGMLVTQDGLLVVKQWNLIPDDLFLFGFACWYIYRIGMAILVVSVTVGYMRSQKHGSIAAVLNGMIGGVVGVFICLTISTALLTNICGPFDAIRFWTSNTINMNGGGTGEIKFIDPLTLDVVAEAVMPDRCSIARMAMIAVSEIDSENVAYDMMPGYDAADEGATHADSTHGKVVEEILVLLGDEYAYQYRYNPHSRTLRKIHPWTRKYRSRGQGNYPATGSTILNNTAYFTDNTFPVLLKGQSYSMYRMPLYVNENDIPAQGAPEPEAVVDKPLHIEPLTAPGEPPGFMFWSVVGSPIERDIIVWDTANRRVQARSLVDLSLHWELAATNADCLTVAADKQHVYLSDWNAYPDAWNYWLGAVGAYHPFHDASKFLIVANTTNGEVLANVSVTDNEGVKISMIIPGPRNDLFIGTPTGLTRVYV